MAVDQGWSKEQEETLARMWAKGCTCSTIGAAIGKTRNAVIGKRLRLGLPGRGETTLKYRGNVRTTRKVNKPPEKRVLTPPHIAKLREFEAKMKAAPTQEPKQTLESAPAPLNLTIIDLTDHTCKWPVNDGGPFLFCGHEKEFGVPYCAYHQRISREGFVRPLPKYREAA